MLNEFAARSLSFAINQALDWAHNKNELLADLAGKVVAFDLAGIPGRFLLLFFSHQIQLIPDDGREVDATLAGSPLALARLSCASREQTLRMLGDDVILTGDTAVAEQVKHLFSELEIDWEEHISQFTGDIIAHQLGETARFIGKFASQQASSLQKNMSEYLQEEACYLPPKEALNDFFADVDKLQLDVDRLYARVREWVEKHSQEED